MTTNQSSLLASRIRAANIGRRTELLPRKYAAMRQSAFRFFRATPTLFYDDWLTDNPFETHPRAWVCADLHIENMGAYRADNGQVYFDVNDFDEALLAPCTVDLARLVTSLFVAAPDLNLSSDAVRLVANQVANSYCQTLVSGKPRSVERDTASGVLKLFLDQVAQRSQRELVGKFTIGQGQHRRLRADLTTMLPLVTTERDAVWAWLEPTLQQETNTRLLDLGFRIAGTSSLALSRYMALVETDAGKCRLVDIKTAMPSVAEPHWASWQPTWPNQATRIVTVQNRLQDVSPSGLHAVARPDGTSFVIQRLKPQTDRINLTASYVRQKNRLAGLLKVVAQLTASAHLRSSGRQGSAIADELIAFAAKPTWVADILHRAEYYAGQVQQDYQTFCQMPPDALL